MGYESKTVILVVELVIYHSSLRHHQQEAKSGTLSENTREVLQGNLCNLHETRNEL